jgi:ADP-heptose:LPS heptosyltransferase
MSAWLEARNILAVRLDNLGDVIMTTPAIAAIKHSSPDVKVTLLGSRTGAATLAHVPALDDAIVYDAPWTKGTATSSTRWPSVASMPR